jgi:hypothetical protein
MQRPLNLITFLSAFLGCAAVVFACVLLALNADPFIVFGTAAGLCLVGCTILCWLTH